MQQQQPHHQHTQQTLNQHGQYQSHHPGQYQQQQQQQQYSYGHDPNQADMGRYRRASSPRQRSTSMTNLNGGQSVIMIPAKKVCGGNSRPIMILPASAIFAKYCIVILIPLLTFFCRVLL
jgi:hypothetical protein